MGERTGISWTDHTFNPWIGCQKVSPGCANCYAEELVRTRMKRDFRVVLRSKDWSEPRRWQKRAAAAGRQELVFSCSISDFFIEEADAWRPEVWQLIRETPNLTWQLLTKRVERLEPCLPPDWDDGYPNVWLGASVENQLMADRRLPVLLDIPARLHFVSAEPLLGRLDLTRYLQATCAENLGWVIVGGESGPDFRPMEWSWARSLLSQCAKASVPFFGKQQSGRRNELLLQILPSGAELKEFPRDWRPELACGECGRRDPRALPLTFYPFERAGRPWGSWLCHFCLALHRPGRARGQQELVP